MRQDGAQIVLGATIGDHQDPVLGVADEVQHRQRRILAALAADRLDREPDKVLHPRVDEHDLDLVPAEEEAGLPVLQDRPPLGFVAQAPHDLGGAAVLRPFGRSCERLAEPATYG